MRKSYFQVFHSIMHSDADVASVATNQKTKKWLEPIKHLDDEGVCAAWWVRGTRRNVRFGGLRGRRFSGKPGAIWDWSGAWWIRGPHNQDRQVDWTPGQQRSGIRRPARSPAMCVDTQGQEASCL